MRRLHILPLTLLAAVALLGGCNRYLAREVQIETTDIATYGSAGADVTLHIVNRGDRPLRLEAAELRLTYDRGEVLYALLRDTVEAAPRWEGDVRLRLVLTDEKGLHAERVLQTSYVREPLRVSFTQDKFELAALDRARVDFTVEQDD